MFYYKVVLLGSALEPLTYISLKEINIGFVVKVTLQGKERLGVIQKSALSPDFECQSIIKTTDNFFTVTQLLLVEFIADYYCCSLGVALNIFTFHLTQKSIFQKLTITPPSLTDKQKEAFDFLNSHDYSLLFGDTGSGKSEIYISFICQTLKEGKNAIYLLPEIGLTPQLEFRLKAFFGDLVAIWHSKLGKKRKEEILKEIYEGKIRVILGARSALFLPLYSVGLIIVDEEHDESYKSNNAPRYNARDLSLMMNKKMGAKVILGSATPNVTTIAKIPHFRLKGSFFESKKEIVYENAYNEISQKMLCEIKSALDKKRQIIIFLPTRAHFKYVTCKNCGAAVECPFCSVAMSLHKNINALKCHYCNFTSKILKICSKCGSDTMEATRLGTAEVVDRLREFFPDNHIEKFDKDEITTDAKLNKILKRFKEREIDILVGTQMLSKGHDYHNVGLSIIMGIDSLLAIPDFKAREKALSLAIQIAGRSGRKDEGRVFIQSKNQEFFEKFLQNYDKFVEEEKKIREGLFPPFKKLMRLLISHKTEQKAKNITDKAVENLRECKDIEIVGYGKADIAKIANKYRYFVLIRSSNAKALLTAAKFIKNDAIQIDMDPLSFS
ncbi:MAG: primosomal protein N' [Campylobacteraceae bacterium]|nr:primosomal protein N' [Campylobacteraceae bacterium]